MKTIHAIIARRIGVFAFLFCGLAIFTTTPAAHVQEISPNLYSGLEWRMIGPFRGGRVNPVAGVPGQSDVFYFGSVGGGVWKTTNAGRTWKPVFDGEPTASIGALAVAASDPSILYVGTGEADMRSDISFGNGVYKSSDGGLTWMHLGLDDTRHIGRILVDPRDPNVVLVGALGHAYGPNVDRGVFRSTDGGASWQKVLYKDENSGAIDLCFDPDNPEVVYASLWQTRRPAWSVYPPSNGPGSGLYKSTDGGETWTELRGHGFPSDGLGRIGIAVAKGNGGARVYAIVDAKVGGLYRSDDAGANWILADDDKRLWGRGWYFGRVTVDLHDPNTVYVPNVALYRSRDGGRNFTAIKGAPGGDDYHSLWIDPENSARMIFGSDQGAAISVDGGTSWSSWYNQPTAQFYHVATDNQFPYWVYGAQQDSGTAAVVSRSDFGGISFRDWHPIGAGESGYIVPDPSNPDIVYGGSTYGELYRFDGRTGQSQDIAPWPLRAFGLEISRRKFRFTWTSPLAFSPFDPHVLYFGAQYLLKTADEGKSWQPISPDLTGGNSNSAAPSPVEPLTLANAKARGYGVIYTIAPSAVTRGLIWVGTDTGLVQLTRDEGKTWTNVTPPGLPAWSKISLIDASAHDGGAAYVAVDRHRLDDDSPWIFRTHDYGKTWTRITAGLAANAYVHAVREDPVRQGLLFAGTETGVYVSFDDGLRWQPLQLNLPVTPIHDLVVHGNDLVVATHGRSFWILDDIAPLRQLNPAVAASNAYLFKPATAIRIRPNVNHDTPLPPEEPLGTNPPGGAVLYYYLKAAPQGDVTLDILDGHGKLVRRHSSADKPERLATPPPFPDNWIRPAATLSRSAGMHRFVWDLRYAKPPVPVSFYSMAAVFSTGTTTEPDGPLVLPGKYEVRLTVSGQTLSRPLTVTMDPRVKLSRADLAAQFGLGMKIYEELLQGGRVLTEIRGVREQIAELERRLAGNPQYEDIAAFMREVDRETEIIARGTGPAADAEEGLAQLNGALAGLAVVVDSADRPPTEQARTAFEQTREAFQRPLARWRALKQEKLSALNSRLREKGLPPIGLL
jgi:photosystem II stability/assembly factor-like uncharacterized protein